MGGGDAGTGMPGTARRSSDVSWTRPAPIVAALIWCVAIGAGVATAEGPAQAPSSDWLFAPKRVALGVLAGGGTSVQHNPSGEVGTFAPRLGYVLADRGGVLPGSLEIIGEAPYLAVSQDKVAHVVGFAMLGKYNFWTGTQLTPFAEAGAGVSYASRAVPTHGTNFNFILQAGAGLQYAVMERVTLDFRTAFQHLSNAGTSSHNPGFNAVLFSLGASIHY